MGDACAVARVGVLARGDDIAAVNGEDNSTADEDRGEVRLDTRAGSVSLLNWINATANSASTPKPSQLRIDLLENP